MERRFILFLLLQLGFFVIQAQDPVQQIWNQIDSVSDVRAQENSLSNSPFRFGTTLGTGFGFSPQLGSTTHMYAAPHVDFQASNRLLIEGGIMAMQSFSNMRETSSEFLYPNSLSTISVYVSATYQLTENLFLHGAGVKAMVNPFAPRDEMNLTYNDFSIGATYKIGNFSIGATLHTSDRGSFYGSPFNNGMFGSPLMW